eukprot:CAMPEP_0172620886 /NCGR_PEP_ID=MMETSP1068-20121228/107091_1 /TAXON_ID=35684 /ORGANISM="Pseudopedinella elastica, Strain CCMP716" /LENGTH=235 /DNA_ID=CAMNT_0013428349 /DNA_START=100 /DNA_END=808 /DNA_ORIENTATION=+
MPYVSAVAWLSREEQSAHKSLKRNKSFLKKRNEDSNSQPRVSRIRNFFNFFRSKPSKPATKEPVNQAPKRPAASLGDDLLGLDVVEAEAEKNMMSTLKSRMEAVSSSEEPSKPKKLYDGRKSMDRKKPGKGSSKGAGDVAGAVLDRPGDLAARKRKELEGTMKKPAQEKPKSRAGEKAPPRPKPSASTAASKERNPKGKPKGGRADDDTSGSVSSEPRASQDDVAKLNNLFNKDV